MQIKWKIRCDDVKRSVVIAFPARKKIPTSMMTKGISFSDFTSVPWNRADDCLIALPGFSSSEMQLSFSLPLRAFRAHLRVPPR